MVAILHPVGPGVQIPIDRAVVLIGRSPECDVVLDVSSKISRLHCALVQVDADYFIRDLGSMNGIAVGGQRVEKEVKLTNNVEVLIGDVKFVFLENVAPAVRTARPVSPENKSPLLIDETVKVLDVDEVQVIETPVRRKAPTQGSPPSSPSHSTIRSPAPRKDGLPPLSPEVLEDVEVVDPEVLEVIEDVEVVDVEEVLDEVEVIEDDQEIVDVEVIEDVEVVDDVDIAKDRPRQRRPPRLR